MAPHKTKREKTKQTALRLPLSMFKNVEEFREKTSKELGIHLTSTAAFGILIAGGLEHYAKCRQG